jgi:hypothetical protein
MSKGRKDKDTADRRAIGEPKDVVDGIADRSPRPRWWKYLVLAAIFALWVAFLVYVKLAGSR